MNFLIVGHTHEDIDAMFGRWSKSLKTASFETIPRLMKFFIDVESLPVIPHLIEEVPDFKKFMQRYLGTGGDFLEGHSAAQQFKFYRHSSGWPLMEYKHLSTDKKWLPEHGRAIRLWSETEDGWPLVPNGSPSPLTPQPMKALVKIKKDLDGFIIHWSRMANEGDSMDFMRLNGPIKEYSKVVRDALDEPLQEREALKDGFWLALRITKKPKDQMREDGTLPEGLARDNPFIERRRDRPRPSFCIETDCFASYFVIVRPTDNDPKPFWLARALTNPNPDLGHIHMIYIQYWTPTSGRRINLEMYAGWDTKGGNAWRVERIIPPCWSNTDCIMTAFKPCTKKTTQNGSEVITRVVLPQVQINIIKSKLEAIMSGSNSDASSADKK